MPYILLGAEQPGDPPIYNGPPDVLPNPRTTTPPDYATVNVSAQREPTTPATATPTSAPTAAWIHHLCTSRPYRCYAGEWVRASRFSQNVVLSDLPSGDLMGIVWGKNSVGDRDNTCVTAPDAQTWQLHRFPMATGRISRITARQPSALSATPMPTRASSLSTDGGVNWSVAQTLAGNSFAPLSDVIRDGHSLSHAD